MQENTMTALNDYALQLAIIAWVENIESTPNITTVTWPNIRKEAMALAIRTYINTVNELNILPQIDDCTENK